jgi:sporulation-control protein
MSQQLSKIRIGAAEVQTVLPKRSFTPGEEIEARVEVTGGDADQHLDELFFAVLTRFKYDEGWRIGVIDEFGVLEPRTIHPDTDETHEITFQFPFNTPLTKGGDKVWLQAGVSPDWTVDESNEPLEIKPEARQKRLFEAVEELGLVFQKSQCTKAPHYMSSALVQELNYRPRSGSYRQKLDEVDVMCDGHEDEMDVYLEIESAPNSVGGMHGYDDMYDDVVDLGESWERFSFQDESTEELVEMVRELLDKNA